MNFPILMSTQNIPSIGRLARQGVVFNALADHRRLAIVHALANGPQPSNALARTIDCTPSAASRHISILRHAGVICANTDTPQITYELNYPCVLGFAECLDLVASGQSDIAAAPVAVAS